jgi:putative membrane protein
VRADRKLAEELDEVIAAVRPDHIILVSDGAEDEQILPLLQSRAKVAHVHRSVVKQAPRLEGFYYVITRLLDDPKQARRFVLPLGIVVLVLAMGYLFKAFGYAYAPDLAWGGILALIAFWLLMHGLKWETRVRALAHDLGEGIRAGKLSLLANLVMLLLIAAGVVVGFVVEESHSSPSNVAYNNPTLYHALIFLQAFLPYMVSAFLVRAAGSLFDSWVRGSEASNGAWAAACVLVFVGLSGGALVDIVVDILEARDIRFIFTSARAFQMTAGIVVLMGGLMVGRYLRAPQPRPQR